MKYATNKHSEKYFTEVTVQLFGLETPACKILNIKSWNKVSEY